MKITIDLIINEGDESEVIEHFRRAYEDCPKCIGRNFISHSILSEYRIERDNTTIFSLGGYRDETLGFLKK